MLIYLPGIKPLHTLKKVTRELLPVLNQMHVHVIKNLIGSDKRLKLKNCFELCLHQLKMMSLKIKIRL